MHVGDETAEMTFCVILLQLSFVSGRIKFNQEEKHPINFIEPLFIFHPV